MEIAQIEKRIAALSAAEGYTPIIVSEEGLERAIEGYPAAWIEMPLVLYVEGREQGVICHKINISLLDDCSDHSFEHKANRLNKMQEDMLSIMTSLSLEEGIVEVTEMSITPRLKPATRHGDISQRCVAKIISYF